MCWEGLVGGRIGSAAGREGVGASGARAEPGACALSGAHDGCKGAHAALGAHLVRAALGVCLGCACCIGGAPRVRVPRRGAPRVHMLGAGPSSQLGRGARGSAIKERKPLRLAIGAREGRRERKKNTPSIPHLR
jgi:hypothetical protein